MFKIFVQDRGAQWILELNQHVIRRHGMWKERALSVTRSTSRGRETVKVCKTQLSCFLCCQLWQPSLPVSCFTSTSTIVLLSLLSALTPLSTYFLFYIYKHSCLAFSAISFDTPVYLSPVLHLQAQLSCFLFYQLWHSSLPLCPAFSDISCNTPSYLYTDLHLQTQLSCFLCYQLCHSSGLLSCLTS